MGEFYTVTRFNFYHNGSGVKHQRMYKTHKHFHKFSDAKAYAKKLLETESCLCVQVDLEDKHGTLDTVYEETK